MKLQLYHEDLKEESANISCSLTRFEHFKRNVRTAIIAVGRATFYDNKEKPGEGYNIIYPPTM